MPTSCNCGHSHEDLTERILAPLEPQAASPVVVKRVEEEEEQPTCDLCDETQEDCECYECEGCGERVTQRNGCDDCYQCPECDRWNDDCSCTTCSHCDERFSDGNGCSSCAVCQPCIERGRVFHASCDRCDGCLSEDSRICENCGHGDCCENFFCDHCYRCDDCCRCVPEEDEDNGYIQNYSCKDYPPAFPNPQSVPANFLYLGVELETEIESESLADRTKASVAIHEKFSGSILQKEDGSLDCGIELVTGKLSLEKHKELWPDVCSLAVSSGLRSWKHGSTGMHVHLSRKFFSPLALGKLLCFVNSDDPTVSANLKKIAGRNSSGYAKKIKKRLCCDDLHSDERYEAVNLCPVNTVEIRIFKGTLNANHVLANIEFCHALAYWVVSEASIQDCENWDAFMSYVLKHRKLYKELIGMFHPELVKTTQSTITEKE